MVIFHILMTIMLSLLSYFAYGKNSTGMIVCVLSFIMFFEFSSGPIVWLYNAEILQDKAVSIAVTLNWITGLAISVCTPLLLKVFDIGTLFSAFAVFTALGTMFITMYMKETKGKTQAEIDEQFDQSDKDAYEKL
jgi:hypothetical protein